MIKKITRQELNRLHCWCSEQREARRNGTLNAERIAKSTTNQAKQKTGMTIIIGQDSLNVVFVMVNHSHLEVDHL